MKPTDEREVVEALRHIKKIIGRIRESDVLECLARDDQPNNTKDPDPYHTVVKNLARAIVIADDHYSTAMNMVSYLCDDLTPKPGRQTTLTDCMRCKQPALGKVRGGLCGGCWLEWQEYRHANPRKCRADFVRLYAAPLDESGKLVSAS